MRLALSRWDGAPNIFCSDGMMISGCNKRLRLQLEESGRQICLITRSKNGSFGQLQTLKARYKTIDIQYSTVLSISRDN